MCILSGEGYEMRILVLALLLVGVGVVVVVVLLAFHVSMAYQITGGKKWF